jgi:hypothetical protein
VWSSTPPADRTAPRLCRGARPIAEAGASRYPSGGTELDASYTEHQAVLGDLDAGVEGPIVWIVCDCGATMARRVNYHAGSSPRFRRSVSQSPAQPKCGRKVRRASV